MLLNFFKYQGSGNDFILIDNRENLWNPVEQDQVRRLCDRRFGIGADGLILLENLSGFDFRMVYFNSDGRESSMCGNGGRCISRFAHDIGNKKEEYYFMAVDGEHLAKVSSDNISLRMKDVDEVQELQNACFLDTGSPHHVYFATEINGDGFVSEAREIRNSTSYKSEGVNVNKVKIEGNCRLSMRTYERGVEDETLSCGTGVTAAVLAYAKNHINCNSVKVETRGGFLEVKFKRRNGSFCDIWLSGPAEFVFKGEIKL